MPHGIVPVNNNDAAATTQSTCSRGSIDQQMNICGIANSHHFTSTAHFASCSG
jgi:hypothetical protein